MGRASMYVSQENRAASAIASSAIVAGIGAMLMFGLQAGHVAEATRALVALDILPPQPTPTPSPTPPPKPSEKSAPKGDPGERNLKNKATQIVAVKPPIVIVPPPPVVVATTPANTGNATQSGMSDRPGPGQGAGDYGSGRGGGGNGGDGDGMGPVTPPRPIVDKLSYRLLPDDIGYPGETIKVGTTFLIRADGRVEQCRITERSRYPAFDAMVCPAVEARFRFRPARNGAGRPIPFHGIMDHYWEVPRGVDRGY